MPNTTKQTSLEELFPNIAKARQAGRHNSNAEDQLHVANELLRGLEILQNAQAQPICAKK